MIFYDFFPPGIRMVSVTAVSPKSSINITFLHIYFDGAPAAAVVIVVLNIDIKEKLCEVRHLRGINKFSAFFLFTSI